MTTGPKYAIEVVDEETHRLVTVEGEIDLASSSRFQGVLNADPSRDLIVDLGEVTFIDSTGVRSILAANQAYTEADRRLLLVFDDGPVERILELTGLSDRFDVHPDREAATAALAE